MILPLLRRWRATAQRRLLAEAALSHAPATARVTLQGWAGPGAVALLGEEDSLQLQSFDLDPLLLLLVERDRLREQEQPADPQEVLETQAPPDWAERRWRTLLALRRSLPIPKAALQDLRKRALNIWRRSGPLPTTAAGELPLQRRAAADGEHGLLHHILPSSTGMVEVVLEPTMEFSIWHMEATYTGAVEGVVELLLSEAEQQHCFPLPARRYIQVLRAELLRVSLRELP
ncbi:MAG TPA: hypothetical protein PKW90_16515 [Myxococcota bacterium]|nr:hypothetical protein [Myxococcota bacterium]